MERERDRIANEDWAQDGCMMGSSRGGVGDFQNQSDGLAAEALLEVIVKRRPDRHEPRVAQVAAGNVHSDAHHEVSEGRVGLCYETVAIEQSQR